MIRNMTALAAFGLAIGQSAIAYAEWNQAKARHFTVYSEGKPDRLEAFATKLEKFDALLRIMTGVAEEESPNPVQVFMLSDDAQVKKLARNPNVAGFYSISDRSGYAILSREPKAWKFGLGPEEILFHEYTHHFMLHYFPAAYPAWYVEGFAEFFSVVKFKEDGKVSYGEVPLSRVPTLVTMSIMPLKTVLTAEADWRNLQKGDQYYGTAWLLTHFLNYHPPRQKQFDAYLKALVNGEKDASPDRFFTGGVETLEKELRAYLKKGRLMRTEMTPSQLPQVSIAMSAMDPARAALIDQELQLMVGLRKDDLPALVATLRKGAAKFPASAHAAALLAEAEEMGEGKVAALASADRAIALDPKLARAHAIRAGILLDRAHDSDKPDDWKAALTAIVKANRADTEDPVPLALFYRYNAMKGGPMPALGYDGLYKAFTLLPQSPSYRFNFAAAMAKKGDYAMASTLLDPLAHSPHPSDMREAALKLKADFDAKIQGKAPPAPSPPSAPPPS